MRTKPDKRGVALVLILMVVTISAALIAAVMYFSLSGTQISGLQRKYETSKEASIGAIDIFTKEIIPLVITSSTQSLNSYVTNNLTKLPNIMPQVTPTATDTCFQNKLTLSTANWVAGCDHTDLPTTNPDIQFYLKSVTGGKNFQVQLKIIDTVSGNSSMSGVILDTGGAAASLTGVIETVHFPYLYTIESQSQMQNDNTQRTNFEVLYAY